MSDSSRDPLSDVDHLMDVLGWGQYESEAYIALVHWGPLEAKEVVVRTGVHQGRIYDTISSLQERGVVQEAGGHPAKFRATNPQKLITEEQSKFEDKSEGVKQRLGTAYEVNFETETVEQAPWTTTNRSGTVREVREQIEAAEESVMIVERDLRWIETSDKQDLQRIDDDGDVRILGWNARRDQLQGLAEFNLETWESSEVEASFYIFDESTFVSVLGDGGGAVISKDESMARVLVREFERLVEQSNRVEGQ